MELASPETSEVESHADGVPVKPYTLCMLFPGHVLTDHLPFGDGLVAFGFISELARRGHRVHVIAQRIEIQQELPPNVIIHSVGARKRGVVQRLLFLVRSRAIVQNLRAAEKLDLVQQLNPVCNGMSLGMLGLGVPIVLGTFVAAWPAPATDAAFALPRRAAAAVLDAARFAISRLQEHFADGFLVTTAAAMSRLASPETVADRVYWIPHGIDVKVFSQMDAAETTNQSILFLANLAPKKGIFTLLDAFEIVAQTLPGARLDVAGAGESFDEVKARVARMPGSGRIRLLGKVERAAVPRLMANAAVYCLPSFGEPYATTVIEAMACGKPIVVTDSGGLRDMVSDEGGRRVEPGNAPQLAAALLEILSSPALRLRMGAYNREVAIEKYDWPRVAESLEAAYGDILRKRATR